MMSIYNNKIKKMYLKKFYKCSLQYLYKYYTIVLNMNRSGAKSTVFVSSFLKPSYQGAIPMKARLISLSLLVTSLMSMGALADARIIVGHFAPFSADLEETSVSVALNGEVALENVKFKTFTDYIPLPAGEYKVDIIPTGMTEPVLSETYTLADNTDYTVFASGDGVNQPLALFALGDDNTAPATGNVKVRVFHAAPFANTLEGTEVSIRTAGGDLVAGLTGVPFGIGSDFLELPEGIYDLKVASNDGLTNYIDPLPVELTSGTIVTLFAVGNGSLQPLGIIATPGGELPLRTPVDNSTNGVFQLADDMGMALAGQGAVIVPLPGQNRMVGTWYAYGADSLPVWYTFDSCLDDSMGCSTPGAFDGMSALTTLYASSGETMMDPQTTTAVGTIQFDVVDCGLILAEVIVGENMPTDYELQRMTPSSSCSP
jgi:hypothetical protein